MLAKILKREETGVTLVLFLLVALFGTITDEFLTLRTWGSLATFASVLGTIAIGSTVLMIAGEFDLSVGSTAALAGMIFAVGVVDHEMNTYMMAAVAIGVGATIGLINGIVTLTTQIPSFITTLGSLMIWRGVVLGMSEGIPVSLMEDRSGVILWFGTNIGSGFYSAVLWWIGCALIFYFTLKHTKLGNHIHATGGDAVAARGMGVNTFGVKLFCFIFSGVMAALAGLILFSQLRDLSPTAGESYELFAIASAVIGGTLLRGGSGTIIGTLMGTLLIGVVQSGLIHAGVQSYWFRTFVGLLLVIAVIMNIQLKKLSEKMK